MVEEKKKEERPLVDQIIEQISGKKSIKIVKEALNKEAKDKEDKLPKIKEKFYFDVKLDCMLPATLTYKVLAEDPQQAAELIKNMSPTGVNHKLIGKKDLKLSVYNAGGSFLRWSKNLLGR